MSNNTSLKEMIYNEVFQSIIKGDYAANDIISEKMLVEKHQVSKSPVREALVELCNEGILRSMPRYGYAVVQLTRKDIENILSYRVILEGGSLRACIHNITEVQLVMLEKIDSACTAHEASCDFFTHWAHNMEFHLKLISFCGNEFSYNMLKKSLDTLTRAYAQFYWDKWNNIEIPTDTKYHVKIINCIRKNDLEGAIHFLKEDISDFGM
jgi:DNA-binding GntR family transcriptional regulator